MGSFNTIWQGDANAMALRAFQYVSTPPWIVNITGPERISVRYAAERLAQRMGKTVRFNGTECGTALLSDATLGLQHLGPPRITADELIDRVADWVSHGRPTLGKPTHFEARDGKF
jgi:hypothetical protein